MGPAARKSAAAPGGGRRRSPALFVLLVLLMLSCRLSGAAVAPSMSGLRGLLAEVAQDKVPDGNPRAAPRMPGSGAGDGAYLRAGGVPLQMPASAGSSSASALRSMSDRGQQGVPFKDPVDVAVPHITLRTNDGQKFGGSLAAVGDILVLGWGDRILASPDAAQGGMFYLSFENMWGQSLENSGGVIKAIASEVRK